MTISTTNTPAPRSATTIYTPSKHTGADTVSALPTTVRSEWIKLSTIRSNKAILGLTALVSAFVAWALGYFITDEVLTTVDVFDFGMIFISVFAAIAGVLVFTSEAQHGTLSLAISAQPRRPVLAASKVVISAAFGAVLGAVGLAAGIAGGALSGIDFGDTAGLASRVLWAVGFTTVAAVLGLGLGMITRNSAAAISGLLAWWLIAENLISGLAPTRYSRFLPFRTGYGMVGVQTGGEEGIIEGLFSQTENSLLFSGYALVAVAIGTLLLSRREA